MVAIYATAGQVRALAAHPAVREAAVTVQSEGEGTRLIAYVVADGASGNGAAPESRFNSLRDHLRQRLPEYMVPSAFVPLRALPRTAGPHDPVDAAHCGSGQQWGTCSRRR